MPIVQSAGALEAITNPPQAGAAWATQVNGGGSLSRWGMASAYASIYASQPAVRMCVDFLAKGIAQIGLQFFRRRSDLDRERLYDYDVANWLRDPNPGLSDYRLFETLMGDLGVYYNAFWLKVRGRNAAGRPQMWFWPLPPERVTIIGALLPWTFRYYPTSGAEIDLSPADVVYFSGYNPLYRLAGLSPIETLRQTLDNDMAAQQNRAAYWHNASRMEGVIERPATAPRWTPEQKRDWRQQWQERFAGPNNAGMLAVLEDGMAWKPTSFSAKDSEYINARKLSREEVAAAYNIPLPMVGILDHATFSNIKEQHKQLYQDTFGPWLQMIEGEIRRQIILEESADPDLVYCEFNIADKLKGSFEESVNSMRIAVGRPFMTANEVRARLNLPQITNDPTADQLAPQQGGPAFDQTLGGAAPQGHIIDGEVVEASAAVRQTVRETWWRQASRLRKLPPPARAGALQIDRCVAELAADLVGELGEPRAQRYARTITDHTLALLASGADPFDRSREVPPCPTS